MRYIYHFSADYLKNGTWLSQDGVVEMHHAVINEDDYRQLRLRILNSHLPAFGFISSADVRINSLSLMHSIDG